MIPIIPCIAFVDNAEEAVAFYRDLFDKVFGNSGETARSHFTQAEIDTVRDIRGLRPEQLPGPAGAVKTVRFRLNGKEILALNGGDYFGKFHESHSLYVSCQTQEQIDSLLGRSRSRWAGTALRLGNGSLRPVLADRAGIHPDDR